MEAVVFIDELVVDLIVCQLQVISSAFLHPTQADRVLVLVLGLGHTAVVECQLFSIFDVLERIHANVVSPIGNGCDCPAVWVA